MAATHCNLEQAITEGRFREDLYYRLNVIAFTSRHCVSALMKFSARRVFRPGPCDAGVNRCWRFPALFSPALLEDSWPGNIRELEDVIRKFLVVRNADVLIQKLRRRRSVRSTRSCAGGERKRRPPEWPPIRRQAQPAVKADYRHSLGPQQSR